MDSADKKNRSLLVTVSVALLLLLALYLRVHAVLHTEVIAPIRSDAADYYSYAYNLRHSGVYSHSKPTGHPASQDDLKADALRTPGYPLFLSPFVSGLPDNAIVTNVIVTQALLSTLSVLIAFLLYRQFLPFSAALGGSVLTSLSPHLITMNVYVLSEALFTFLLLLTFWLFALYQKKGRKVHVFLAGLTLGAATLTRPSIQYFFVIMLFMLYFLMPGTSRIKAMGALALGFILVIGPWHIRNVVSTGESSDSRLMINFLHHGMYPDFQYEGRRESTGFPYRFDPDSATISKDIPSVLLEIEHRFVTEPAEHLHWYLVGKPAKFWSWDMVQGMGDVFVYEVRSSPYFGAPIFQLSHRFMHEIYYPVVILALMATMLVWLPQWAAIANSGMLFTSRCISLLLIYYTALHIVGAPFPRYSIPILPFLYGMAALGVFMLVQWSKGLLGSRSSGGPS